MGQGTSFCLNVFRALFVTECSGVTKSQRWSDRWSTARLLPAGLKKCPWREEAFFRPWRHLHTCPSSLSTAIYSHVLGWPRIWGKKIFLEIRLPGKKPHLWCLNFSSSVATHISPFPKNAPLHPATSKQFWEQLLNHSKASVATSSYIVFAHTQFYLVEPPVRGVPTPDPNPLRACSRHLPDFPGFVYI